MGIFKKLKLRKRDYLALDIGSRGIKAVKLSMGAKPLITDYIYLASENSLSQNPFSEEQLISLIRQISDQFYDCDVIIGIVGPNIITRDFFMPEMTKKELDQAVRFEAEKHLSRSIEELIIDYIVIDKVEVKGIKQQHILVAAVLKDFITSLYQVFQDLKMKLIAVDLQALALWRSLTAYSQAYNNETAVVIGIGARYTQFVVVEKGFFKFTKTFSFGGSMISENIARNLGIDLEKAVQLKKNYKMDGNSPSLKGAVEESLDELLIKTADCTREFLKLRGRGAKIDKIVLSGGTSRLKNLDGYLQKKLHLPVEIGYCPIEVSQKAKAEILNTDNKIKPELNAVVGLALWEVVG